MYFPIYKNLQNKDVEKKSFSALSNRFHAGCLWLTPFYFDMEDST